MSSPSRVCVVASSCSGSVMLACTTLLALLAIASRPITCLPEPDGGYVASNPHGICALLVTPRGYPCQEFKVATGDGFLLSMQRIGSSRKPATNGPALLYHGLMQGGDIWVLNEASMSLGFVLADGGYDVWLGSTRSSTFSYGHVTLHPTDQEFWDWDWDDLVAQDLPTMLRFVHNKTNELVCFVGYSQGSMTGFAAFTHSETAGLVKKAAMLSPIAYLRHVSSPLASAVAWLFLDKVLLLAGVHQFNISDDGGKEVIDAACENIRRSNCYNDLLSLVTGPNCCINETLISSYDKFELQTTSMRNLAQMAQLLRTGRFGMYDHGWFRNLMKYGHFRPPSYDLGAIPERIPFFLVHGGQDELADEMDVRHLLEELPGATQLLFVPSYAHGDFVLGSSAKTMVYDNILLFFNNSL